MITRAGPRIFVSAGEPSGDLHGAGVVRALRDRYPHALIEALGGPRMAQAGATLRYDMQGLADRMAQKGGVLGAMGKMAKFAGKVAGEKVIKDYFVEVAADVEGTPVDATSSMPVRVHVGD